MLALPEPLPVPLEPRFPRLPRALFDALSVFASPIPLPRGTSAWTVGASVGATETTGLITPCVVSVVVGGSRALLWRLPVHSLLLMWAKYPRTLATSSKGAPPAGDLRWFMMVPPSSGHGGDFPFSIWFMHLRLLVRYSFWTLAASIGSYSGLDGLGCLCRPGIILD